MENRSCSAPSGGISRLCVSIVKTGVGEESRKRYAFHVESSASMHSATAPIYKSVLFALALVVLLCLVVYKTVKPWALISFAVFLAILSVVLI